MIQKRFWEKCFFSDKFVIFSKLVTGMEKPGEKRDKKTSKLNNYFEFFYKRLLAHQKKKYGKEKGYLNLKKF